MGLVHALTAINANGGTLMLTARDTKRLHSVTE